MSPELPHWSRRRFLGAGAVVSAAVALGACNLDRGSSPDESAREGGPTDGWSGERLDPPWTKPDVTFTDLDGAPFPFAERTAGKLSLLFFGYTNCPDICPVYLSTLASAREAIGTGPGSRPDVYFVGVDLARDTPEVVQAYLANIDPTFQGLTGSEEVIAEALAAIYAPPVELGEPDADGSYEVGHPSWVTVYQAEDDRAHRRYPYGVRQQDWVKDLPRLAAGEST